MAVLLNPTLDEVVFPPDITEPDQSFLINSPTSQPHRFRTPNAPNHRHTRPTLPPFLRRADDGLDAVASLPPQLIG